MNFKTLFYLLFLTAFFVGCEKEQVSISDDANVTPVKAQVEQGAFDANVSILDIRARSVSETSYAQEIYFVTFSDYNISEDRLIFSDMLYADDGKSYDLIAGDGIFTAVSLQEFSKEVPFLQKGNIRSLLEKPIVSQNFLHEVELIDKMKAYSVRFFNETKVEVTIKCQVTIEECPNENWWDTSWFGEPCLVLRDCTITIK